MFVPGPLRGEALHFGEIGAGDEGPVSHAGQDRDAEPLVLGEPLECLRQLLLAGDAKRVALLWIVDRDVRDMTCGARFDAHDHQFRMLIGRHLAPDAASVARMYREAQPVRGREVREHRFMDGPQVPPWIRVAVEAPQEEEVGQHAFHPVHVGRIADDGPAARPFQELLREPSAACPCQHAARGEIDEVFVGAAHPSNALHRRAGPSRASAVRTVPGEP